MGFLINLEDLHREPVGSEQYCGRCDGEGFIDNERLDGIFETDLFESCPTCRGTGITELPKCGECEGRGRIWEDQGRICHKCNGQGHPYEPILPDEAMEKLAEVDWTLAEEMEIPLNLQYRLFIPGSNFSFYVVAHSGETLWGLCVDTDWEGRMKGDWRDMTQDQLRCLSVGRKYVEWDKGYSVRSLERWKAETGIPVSR